MELAAILGLHADREIDFALNPMSSKTSHDLVDRLCERWTVSPKNRMISSSMRLRPSAMMTTQDFVSGRPETNPWAPMLKRSAERLLLRSSKGSF
jgi:hypothetical protein